MDILQFIIAFVIAIIAIISSPITPSAARRRFTDFTITSDAERIFHEYIESHPLAAAHETKCSGIDVLDRTRVHEYFQIELTESYHADVVAAIRARNGTFDADAMQRWRDENYRENYVLKKTGCD